MAYPVIGSSGHTFEWNCVHACVSLSFTPKLANGSNPDFSTIIPNLALKSTIFNWCWTHLIDTPKPIDFYLAEKLASTLIHHNSAEVGTELTQRPRQLSVIASEELVTPRNGFPTPLPLKTRPACYSSSSSSNMEILNSHSLEDEEFIMKLRSSEVSEQQDALISHHKLMFWGEDSLRVKTTQHSSVYPSMMDTGPAIKASYSSQNHSQYSQNSTQSESFPFSLGWGWVVWERDGRRKKKIQVFPFHFLGLLI